MSGVDDRVENVTDVNADVIAVDVVFDIGTEANELRGVVFNTAGDIISLLFTPWEKRNKFRLEFRNIVSKSLVERRSFVFIPFFTSSL